MSYRDSKGRFRRRNGIDILEQYGACAMIVLLVTSPAWIMPFMLWAQEVLS